MKFLEPTRKPKVMSTDTSLEFGKSCEESSWNHCTLNTTQIRNKRDCWKSSAQSERRHVCCIVATRSGWEMMGGFHGMLLLSAKHTRSLVWREDTYERRFGMPSDGPVIPFGAMVEYHPISAKDQSRLHQFGAKVLPGTFLGYGLYAGGNLERRHYGSSHRRIGGDGCIWTPRQKAQCKGSVNAAKKWKLPFSWSQMEQSKSLGENSVWEHPP